MEKNEIIVKDIINSKIAINDKDGDTIFNTIIEKATENLDPIILNFDGIDLVNTAFLNNAVDKLFDSYLFDLKTNRVLIQNMSPDKLELLKETISVARDKYVNI